MSAATHVDLGDGLLATFVWGDHGDAEAGRLPVAATVDHGDHVMLVQWVAVDGDTASTFTLDSLLPLTVVETVRCRRCGVQGRIEQGTWVPEERA